MDSIDDALTAVARFLVDAFVKQKKRSATSENNLPLPHSFAHIFNEYYKTVLTTTQLHSFLAKKFPTKQKRLTAFLPALRKFVTDKKLTWKNEQDALSMFNSLSKQFGFTLKKPKKRPNTFSVSKAHDAFFSSASGGLAFTLPYFIDYSNHKKNELRRASEKENAKIIRKMIYTMFIDEERKLLEKRIQNLSDFPESSLIEYQYPEATKKITELAEKLKQDCDDFFSQPTENQIKTIEAFKKKSKKLIQTALVGEIIKPLLNKTRWLKVKKILFSILAALSLVGLALMATKKVFGVFTPLDTYITMGLVNVLCSSIDKRNKCIDEQTKLNDTIKNLRGRLEKTRASLDALNKTKKAILEKSKPKLKVEELRKPTLRPTRISFNSLSKRRKASPKQANPKSKTVTLKKIPRRQSSPRITTTTAPRK